MTHASHRTRFSDSSQYDEICKACGGTDTRGSTTLDEPCAKADATALPWSDVAAERKGPTKGDAP